MLFETECTDFDTGLLKLVKLEEGRFSLGGGVTGSIGLWKSVRMTWPYQRSWHDSSVSGFFLDKKRHPPELHLRLNDQPKSINFGPVENPSQVSEYLVEINKLYKRHTE